MFNTDGVAAQAAVHVDVGREQEEHDRVRVAALRIDKRGGSAANRSLPHRCPDSGEDSAVGASGGGRR